MLKRDKRPIYVSAEDVRQYTYCPATIVYRRVYGIYPHTERTKLGKQIHRDPSYIKEITYRYLKRISRREIIVNHEYRITAEIDYIATEHELTPIEVKLRKPPITRHHKAQLIAQAIALELTHNTIITHAYIIYIENKTIEKIAITDHKKTWIAKTIVKIRNIIEGTEDPQPTPHKQKCTNCEYRKICTTKYLA
ncbi:MAG: CRISPR-associated protein Cas4 [Thermoprotei archaeon]|nr:MAG: CRISPR-associated protein Cas4 [Thermoprotei archaeon]